MDTVNTKAWYESKTVWANIISTILTIAVAFGFISAEASADIGTNLSETVAMVGVVVANAIAIWTRITADKKIN